MTGAGPGDGAAVGVVLDASDTDLAGWIESDFGFSPVALERVAGGADSAAVVWRAGAPDGTTYAVKLSARPEMVAGLRVAAHLAANAVPGIPPPVPARTGRPWSVADGAILSLTPWVPGRLGAETGLDAGQWRSFGSMLAAVHTADLPESLAADLPRETYATPMVTETRDLDARLRNDRAESDDLGAAVAATWLDASDRLLALADRAETLGRRLRGRPAPTALCHGDAHILNLLVGADGRLTLIDWDDVVLSPPERDLMFVAGGGVLADPLVTAEQQGWFFAGYAEIAAEVGVDADRLAFYRCCRAIDDAAQFAVLALDAERRSRQERRRALDFLRLVLSPCGLVTLAGAR